MNPMGLKCAPTILTSDGVYFNLLEPERSAGQVSVRAIAHALSNVARFAGHASRHYSVAQHSVYCAMLVPEPDRLAALMHDVAEAIIGDVATPLKQLLPDYREIERRVEHAFFKRFGLPTELPASVKAADLAMLATERAALLPYTADDSAWTVLDGVEPAPITIAIWTPDMAATQFMHAYFSITKTGAFT